MVVKLSEGKDAIQTYVAEQVARGLPHVLETIGNDHNRILALIGDLTEDEAMRVTPADEWRVFDVMKHLSASLDRSRSRLEALSAGRPFEPPPGVMGGSMGSAEYESFSALRCAYIDGMVDILAVLRNADPGRGLDLLSEHATFGSFNWPGWALYSHHVHTHDHVGQIENIRKALRAR